MVRALALYLAALGWVPATTDGSTAPPGVAQKTKNMYLQKQSFKDIRAKN